MLATGTQANGGDDVQCVELTAAPAHGAQSVLCSADHARRIFADLLNA